MQHTTGFITLPQIATKPSPLPGPVSHKKISQWTVSRRIVTHQLGLAFLLALRRYKTEKFTGFCTPSVHFPCPVLGRMLIVIHVHHEQNPTPQTLIHFQAQQYPRKKGCITCCVVFSTSSCLACLRCLTEVDGNRSNAQERVVVRCSAGICVSAGTRDPLPGRHT